MKFNGCIGLVVALVSWAAAVQAELKLPLLFSDGMVLQRSQPVPVWGWADPAADVVVSFAGQEQKAQAGADGKFMVRLAAMEASEESRTLVVKAGDETRTVSDVLVGEVWLCSGQSNMEWPVSGSQDFEKEQAAASYPLIRMFLTDKKASLKPQADCTGSWNVCAPETVGKFSATAYFFGRRLHAELGVPVGLIRSAWGGTRIEAWSPMASLEKYPAVMENKAQEDAKAATYDPAEAKVQLDKQLALWQENVKKAQAAGKKVPKKPALQSNPHSSQNYPANLYNAMIVPLEPYGMRGAIWYQGEANALSCAQAVLYRDLLENLVAEWRKQWGAEFPFYAVQMVNFKKPQTQPVEDSGWAFVRDSFLDFHKEVPNVGIAVGIEVGEADNIHPKNKQAIGHRLAQQALAKTYGRAIVPGGPLYRSMKQDGNKIILQFDDIGAGLVAQDGAPLKRFAIAGADRRFVVAEAAIVGSTVVVQSPEVPEPVAVRYAWADNPTGCNLFNKDGFPASPFRTDDWPPTAE